MTRMVLTCVLLLAGYARATTRTWTGGGADNNWSTSANWSPAGAPAAGDALVFGGNARLSPNNDLAAWTSFLSISFASGAGNFSLNGNPVSLSGGSGALASNAGSGQMTVFMDLAISANTTITVASGGTLLLLGSFDNAGWPFSSNGQGNLHFGGPITGSGALTTTGSAGVVKLQGHNGSFTGSITVSAGILVLDHPNGLGATGQGTTVAAGAVLDMNGVACATAEPLTLYGTGISSTGALVNNAAGGAVFPGPITLGSSALIAASNGTLALSGTTPIAGNYALTLGGAGSGSLAAGLGSGIAALTKAGAGTWALSGNGSASVGGTTVSGGTLDLGNPGSIGSGGITLSGGNLSFHDNGSGSNTLIDYGRGLTVAGGAAATITVANAGANTGNTIRLASLTCGNTTLNVSGANGYRLQTGPVTLNGSPSGTVYLNPSGADLILGSIAGGAYPYTLDLGGASAGNRVDGAIADGSSPVSIAKSGNSVWTLAGTNAYTGATSVNGGALVLGSGQALGSTAGGTTVAAGAMLDLAGTTYSSAEPLTLNGTGIAGSGALANSNPAAAAFPGPITLGSASSIVGESGAINLTHAGSLGGPYTLTLGGSQGGSFSANPSGGSLAKTGTGTWTRSGSSGLALNSLSLSQGTFSLGSGMLHTLSSSLAVTGGVLDFGSSTLQVSASSVDLSALAGLTAGTGILEFSSASNQSFIPSAVGNPKLKKSGTGTLVVNGALDAGALDLTAGTWDWGSGTPNHAVNGIATGGSSIMAFGNTTVSVREGACDLSGLASMSAGSATLVLLSNGSQAFTPRSGAAHPKVVKAGTGTTSLGAADLSAAGMQVQAGTLDLGNRSVTVSGNLSVSGGTLEAIAAGLTVTGDLVLSGGNLSMPSGTLYVGGNVSRTGGTAAHNNGWLTLNGPSPGKAFDFSPTLYNLNVSASGGGWVAANHGFTVANLFQVQNGAFGLGAGLAHSASSFNSMGGSLDFGSATLAISGATAYFPGLASLTTGTGTLEFVGSGAQAFYPITGYAFPTVKRSGTGTVTLTGGPLLVNTLLLSGGTLNLGAGLATTASALGITGGSLDFASGTLKLGGATADFTALASLAPGTGTLEFNGSSAQTFVPKASLTFPGLTQSGTGGTTVATNGFASNGPLSLVYGTFDLGASLSHSAASLSGSAGSLAFNNSTLNVTSGDADLSALASVSAGTGTLAFTAASGTQTLTPRSGAGHPAILHSGAGTLALANYDLSCLAFSQTAGSLDFGGRDIATASGGNFSIANGTSSSLANLSGRTLTVAGNASLAGTSAANRLNLNPASAWTLAVSGSLTASLASLGNSSASVSAGACGDCSDAGGNSNWTYSVHWVGGGGSPNWSLPANWGSGSVPGGGEDILFDSGPQNALLDVTATVKSLTMSGGYTGAFDFGTQTLNVTGNADFRSGGGIVPGTGTLAFTGTGAQAFVPKPGATFPAIVQNGNAGTTTVTTHPLRAASLALGLGTFHLGSSLTHTVGSVSGSGALDFGTSNLNATGNVNLAFATVTASGANLLSFTGSSAQAYAPNASVTGLMLAQNGAGGTAIANYDFATPSLTIAAGVLDLGTGRTHSAGSLSVSGGGLDFKSSTLRVAGTNVDFSALATLSAGTGTLEFNGASPQAFKPKASAAHPHVKQNGAGGVSVTGNDLVTGTLSVTSGAFALGAGRTVTASGLALTGGTLDFSGGTLKTSAAAVDLGPVALLGAASGTLEFTGNSAQTFSPKAGVAAPNIVHSGTGTATLAANALSTASLSVGAGGFDLGALPLAAGAITVTGGTLTATNGSIDLNGNLSVTGGRIDFPAAGAFTISGSVAIASAAAVGHNSGTLTLDGNAAGKTLDIDNAIYGLTVNGSGGAWTVSGHRLWAEGALTLANGSLSLGSGFTHSVGSVGASGGSLDFGGSTLGILYGNANLGGLAALTPGTGTLGFISTSGNQILTPKAAATHPAIAHTGSMALQLSANDLVCQGFSNTAGGLDLNGRNLTVNNGGNLSIANGTAATFANLAGSAITVAGNADFAGTSGANRLNLDPASAWTLAVTGSLTASRVSLANNAATVAAGTCSDCANGGGNANWAFAMTWDGGGADNNWTTAANWGGDAVPTASDIAAFDATSSKNAVLDADAGVKSISLAGAYTGAFDFGSHTLTVSGNADFRSGGAIVPGTGALAFAGAGAQTFYPKAGAVFPALIASGTGTTTVSGTDLSAGNLSVTSGAFDLGTGTRAVKGISGSGTLAFGASDLIATGNVDLSALAVTPGGRTLLFQGASPQTFKPNAALTGLSIAQAGTGGTTVLANGFSVPALSISAGTFNLGSGLAHTVANALALGNGGLDFGGSTLRVAAAAADFSGLASLARGTGALHFTGASAQTFTPKAGTDFPALVQNGTGGATVAGNPLQAASLTVQAGTFGFGNGSGHTLNGIASTGGGLDFGSATVALPAGDADLSGLASLTAGTGKLIFAGATGTQTLKPKAGALHPVIEHNGAGILRLAGNALLCAAFRNLAGGFDLNGMDLTANGALDLFGGAGTLANLGGRTLTAGGNATFRGQPSDRLGLAPGAPWTLAVSGLLKAANADIGGSIASVGPGTADSSVDLGGNANWTFLDSVPPAPVSAFQASRAGAHAVRLAWSPSASPDADSVMIRYRADGAYPADRADGVLWGMVPKTDSLDTAFGLPDKAILAFAAFARDSSGNYAAPSAAARDTARMPDVTAPSGAKAFVATALSASAAALSWAAPDSADVDSILIRYRTDGQYPADPSDGTLLRMVSNAVTRDTATTLTANLTYHFGLFARDSSGNWSAAAPGARDTSLYQAPVLGSLAVTDFQGFTRDTDPALLFTASGADSLRFSLLSDTALAPWVALRARDSLDLGAGADGKRIVAAQFKNAYGRRTAWYLDTTALDRTAPVVSLDLKPAHSWRDWPGAVAGRARDGLAGTDSVFMLRKRLADGYAFNGSGWTTVPDTARFRADSVFSAPLPGSALATGAYEFTVWAKDRLGNVSAPAAQRVDYAENRAPELDAADPVDTVNQNQPVDWSIAIGDRDVGDSVLAVSVLAPAWLRRAETSDTGQGGFAFRRVFAFAGTPGQADVAAASVLTVQVRDLGGQTFLYSRTFAVIDVNDAPAFLSGRDSIAAMERAVTRYIPRYRDPDPADKASLALLAAPPWATLEDSALVLRPGSRDVGRASVRIAVSDGRLLDTLDLDVDVANRNDAPVAFPGDRWPAPAAWKEDVPDSFTVVVVDMDKNDKLGLLAPLPAFLTYRESTDSAGINHFFRFASAPAQKDTGTYPIRLRFADAAGAVSELSFTAKVAPVNDTPLAVIASVRTSAGAARIGLDAKDDDGSAAATRFHYRLIDARGDTVRAGICAGTFLALQPLADGDYTLALAAEDEGGLRQSAYTRAGLAIAGATTRSVDSARWDMLAYPGRALAASALGAAAGLATWDEASGDGSPGRYATGKAADSLLRGKGYWVKATRRVVLSAPFAELTDKAYPLKLVRGKQGWNQIGNPYPYYVDLSATGFTFWEWDPSKRDLSDAKGILRPWGAYWVQVARDTTLTIPNRPWFPAAAPLARVSALAAGAASPADGGRPASGQAPGPGPAVSDPESWSLQLALSAGPYRDEANFLGIRRAAGPASGGLDRDGTLGEAPKFGEYVALRFERPGTGKADGPAPGFAADFRPGLSGDEVWWDFAVENRGTGLRRADLGLPGLEALAARGLYAFLVDRGVARPLLPSANPGALPGAMPGAQASASAAADNLIGLAMGDSIAHYSLVVTPHPDFAARLQGDFNISQNFPNPARELTTFRFFLPQAWDADGKRLAKAYPLRLNVYDYRGRLAATVAQGAFAPGPHTLAWRPQAKGGGPLAPGAYVYRLETANFAKSLKLLVK